MNLASVQIAAEMSGVSEATMRRWASLGRHGITAQKIGGTWIIDSASLPSKKGSIARRARALLMEMHGVAGCDPNCEARYHEMFPPLTQEEFDTEVGHLYGIWPDGTSAALNKETA